MALNSIQVKTFLYLNSYTQPERSYRLPYFAEGVSERSPLTRPKSLNPRFCRITTILNQDEVKQTEKAVFNASVTADVHVWV